MRVLVTGGAGFIGSHLVRLLRGALQEDHDVAVLDALTYAGCRENALVGGDRFYRENINSEWVVNCLREFKPTHIAHLAAETHVCASIEYPQRFVETNVQGTLNLLEAIRGYGKPVRLLHVSTDEVYGDLSGMPRADETGHINPSNPYSASKAAGEMLARSYHRTYGLDVVVARPCNNFGPGQYPEKFIPRSIERAEKGLPVEIHGDGHQTREWLHVFDCCLALEVLLKRGESGEVYNVGSGLEMSVETIADVIARHYGVRTAFVADRPGGDRRYAMRSAKMRALGWQPRRSVMETIEALMKPRIAA